jgi:chemosensory pili system protein ChpA (sensor histidine kinase/response regulator)
VREVEQVEAERVEAERVEAERVEAERVEAERASIAVRPRQGVKGGYNNATRI